MSEYEQALKLLTKSSNLLTCQCVKSSIASNSMFIAFVTTHIFATAVAAAVACSIMTSTVDVRRRPGSRDHIDYGANES